jgi:sec-independent protein translocase protein TatA
MTGLITPGHIVLLALVALVLFGPKRLPEIGRSLGRGMREFKDSVADDGNNDGLLAVEDPPPEASAAAAADPGPGTSSHASAGRGPPTG